MANAVACTLVSLPYDIIRQLCTLMEAADISALLRTCHNLYPLNQDDAIWLELCKRYNVQSAGVFGARSSRILYTELLHRYGPLLGLWASDHPYKGSVIEFRLDRQLKGIVGEVWRSWPRSGSLDVDEMLRPNPPEYFRFMHVALAENGTGQVRAQLNWHVRTHQEDYYGPGTTWLTVPTLHVVSETNQDIVADVRHEQVRLPAFPPVEPDLWYDRTRELPRMRPSNDAFISTPPHTEHSHISVVARITERPGPPALMVRPSRCGEMDPFAEHEPWIQIFDLRNSVYDRDKIGWFYRRFYPLRHEIRHGQNPGDEHWSPESLEGLWLGSSGPDGTELLHLEYNREAEEIRAWKVTGNLNVPRGACAWRILLRLRLEAARGELLGFTRLDRLYGGRGIISSVGFLERERDVVALVVSVESEDEIAICWSEFGAAQARPRYVRYKGRNISSETREHLLRRPFGWTP